MSLLIDIIVIIAFVASFIAGIKRGFIKSIMGIVVVIVAIVGSVQLNPVLSEAVNEKFVEKAVINVAKDAVGGIVSDGLTIKDHLNEKSEVLTKTLSDFGVKLDIVSDAVEENPNANNEEMVDIIAVRIGEPLALKISKAAAFIVSFVVLYLLLLIVSLIICGVAKLPVIRTANKLLGGILGAATGILLAWGLSVALSALMPQLAKLYEAVPATVIENSIVVKFLGSIDPTGLIK